MAAGNGDRDHMTDVYHLIPKDKFDNSNIEKLKPLTDREIEPILPALLEWVRDRNWPIFDDILSVLILHQTSVIPYIHSAFSPKEGDNVWKYWIITCLIPLFSEESINTLLPDIQRIADAPTQGEADEEADKAAALLLQDRLSKSNR